MTFQLTVKSLRSPAKSEIHIGRKHACPQRHSRLTLAAFAVICFLVTCGSAHSETIMQRSLHISRPDFSDVAPWGEVQKAGLPLGLYLNRNNIEDIRKWYSRGIGEASKFHFTNPHLYLKPIDDSLLKIDLENTSYNRPSGMWQLSTCAFAYALTGDRDCGQAARKMLLYLANQKSWALRGSIAPFEESFVVKRMAICYDLIYTMLSKEDRELIANAVENKGLQPIREYVVGKGHWTLRPLPYNGNPGYLQHSNQAATYLGAYYLGARLLYDHTGKPDYKNEYIKAARATQTLLENYFPPDGSVTAAPGYYLLTLEELCDVIVPMAQTLGLRVDDFLPAGAHNPFLFSLYLRSNAALIKDVTRYPLIVPFGDSSYSYLIYDPVKKDSVGARYWALAVWSAYVADPNLLWMYKQFADVPFEFGESASSLVSHYYRSVISKAVQPAEPYIPHERLFENAGLFVWRDGFMKGDKMFALWKRVYKEGDHLHNDQNNIMLEAFGERYLTDRGVDYAKDKELGLSLSFNHNAITIDRENNLDGPTRMEILPYLVSEHLNYAESDASYRDSAPFIRKDPWRTSHLGAVSQKSDHAVRAVLYVKPDYYIVFDSLHTIKPASAQCNFISAAPVQINGRWITYQGKDSRMEQYAASPEKIGAQTRNMVDSEAEQVWGVSIETDKPVQDVSFLNLFFPLRSKSAKPAIERDSNETGTRLVIDRKSSRELILQKNRSASVASIGDSKSDAEIAILMYKNNNFVGGGMFNGTFVEVDGKKIVSTDNKSFIIFYALSNDVYGTAQTEEGTRVTFYLWDKPILLTLSNTDGKGYSSFASFR